MNKWLQRQNAYSIIKLMTMCMYLYTMVSSLIFSLDGYTTLGMYFSGSIIYYLGVMLISFTPKGRKYYTNYFRTAVVLLASCRLYHEIVTDISIKAQQRFSAIFLVLLVGFFAYLFGAVLNKSNHAQIKVDRQH